jgi:predicted component of type VI protein secretion system
VDVSLVMVKADGSMKEAKLDRASVVIGRDESARFRIPISSISRKHCEVFVDDDELMVKDLGSSNGTYVNGQRVKETELSPGDLLTIGGIVFVVRIDGFPRDIDAKDCYAAGSVGAGDDDDDELINPPKPAPSSAPTKAVGPKPKKADDDDFDLDSLLKDLGDDDEPPKKK